MVIEAAEAFGGNPERSRRGSRVAARTGGSTFAAKSAGYGLSAAGLLELGEEIPPLGQGRKNDERE